SRPRSKPPKASSRWSATEGPAGTVPTDRSRPRAEPPAGRPPARCSSPRDSAGPPPRSVLFSERFACPVCGLSFPELEPRQFSFNSPFGACPDCHGVGTRREVNADLILGDPSISILEGVILPWGEPTGYLRKVVLPTLAKAFKFDLSAPWAELSEEARGAILYGAPGRFRFSVDGGRGEDFESAWEGVLRTVERRNRESTSDSVRESLEEYMIEQPCQSCG